MKLQFSASQIQNYASRYEYPNDDVSIRELVPAVRQVGYLTRDQLYQVARWKAARSSGNVKENTEMFVQEVTRWALQAHEERSRIQGLTILDGVGWPMASVILHFFHSDKYPILDFRALEALGQEKPNQYEFSFWWSYVETCRKLARDNALDMRTLDRALWQYSKEQGTDSPT